MIEPSLVQPDDRRRPAVPLRMRRLRHAGSRTTTSLGAVLDAVPMLVLLIDERERLTWMNAEAERVLGWRLEELEDRNLLAELLPEPDAYESAIRQVREGSPSWSRLRIRSRGGRRIDCTWRALPSPEGGFAVLLRPNAEHPEETGAGDADRSRQPQKLEAIGRFAGGIAHDFNNLLTAIRCGTELLIEQLPREGSYHRDLEEIQGAASRAATLVRQLLAFSRRQVLQPVSLDLNVVVTDMEHLLRRIMGEDVEIATVLDPELPPLTADPAQMEQVVMNLAVNARDAMPDGGALVITTESRSIQSGEAQRLGLKPGEWTVLTVADTGHGMDIDTRERAFEPFFTTREDTGGSGLGLSTVYGIVRQSGGSIDVHSELGRGTRFTIHFPASAESLDADDATRHEPGVRPRRITGNADQAPVPVTPSSPVVTSRLAAEDAPVTTETLLLAEDDDSVRTLAARVLRAAGFRVVEARDGIEALQRWRTDPEGISALITDLRMPGGGGLRLADSIRKDHPSLPVIFMSGYSDTAPDALAGNSPMLFVAKPFTGTALVASVRQLLTTSDG